MKKIARKVGYTLSILLFSLLAGLSSFAQGTDSLSSTTYSSGPPTHLDPLYNGSARFIILGIAIAAMLAFTYHYYKQASMGKDIWHDPS